LWFKKVCLQLLSYSQISNKKNYYFPLYSLHLTFLISISFLQEILTNFCIISILDVFKQNLVYWKIMLREKVIKILLKLQPYWNQAEKYITAVQSQYFSDRVLHKLANILAQAINTTQSSHLKNLFIKSQEQIKQLQENEAFDREKEQEELEEINNMLQDL